MAIYYGRGSVYSSSPALGADGAIYVGSCDDNLYALNPDGSLKWQYTTGKPVKSSPAIGVDGTIYVGSDDKYLYAIDQGPSQPVLTLTKTVDFIRAVSGETMLYNLAYCNFGANATDVTITDILPTGISYVTGSADAAASYNAASDTLTWSLGALTPGNFRQSIFPGSGFL